MTDLTIVRKERINTTKGEVSIHLFSNDAAMLSFDSRGISVTLHLSPVELHEIAEAIHRVVGNQTKNTPADIIVGS